MSLVRVALDPKSRWLGRTGMAMTRAACEIWNTMKAPSSCHDLISPFLTVPMGTKELIYHGNSNGKFDSPAGAASL